jgi:hypothetical protein
VGGQGLVHWDEADGRIVEAGALGATWTDLGRAWGSVTTGLKHHQRANKLPFRGLGVSGLVEPRGFWDGEPRA